MKQLYKYALVRFMPFVETGEFANVGVLLCAPESGVWQFKLAPTRFGRITSFFSEMESNLYKLAMNKLSHEMRLTQKMAQKYKAKGMLSFFNEVARTREGMIQFGNVRTLISDVKPKAQLDRLFEHYVYRSFANEHYREQQLISVIKNKLITGRVPVQYKERVFKVDFREIKIPLSGAVQEQTRLIKPLAFFQERPTAIFEHGEQWANRIQALIENEVVNPDKVLMPLEVDKQRFGERADAYEAVLDIFKQQGIKTTDYKNDKLILEFASGIDN